MAQPRSVNAPKPRFLKADRWLIPARTGQSDGMRGVAGSLVLVLVVIGSAQAGDALKASIPDGIAKVRPAITACGEASAVGGTVEVKVEVGAGGKVTSVAASGTRDPKLETCVADALETTTFGKTDKGGSFSYTFALATKVEANGDLGDAIYSSGLQKISTRLGSCGNATKIGGIVTVRVTLDAAGKVTAAKAQGSEDTQLLACITDAIKTATFKPTARGGSFSYSRKYVSSEQLDRDLVERSIAKYKAQLLTCAAKSPAAVTFTITGSADPDGVLEVSANSSAYELEATGCMYKVLKTATFEKTPHGGHFTYTLDRAEVLDSAVIGAGIASVKAKVVACGNASKVGGSVKVRAKVAAGGKVTNVTAEGSTDAKLNTCVAKAVKAARFAKTASGGAFVYPFLFATPDALPALQPDVLVGDELDRAAIATGIAGIKASIVGCGNDSKVGGTVKVHVQVSPDGKVANASIEGKTDAKLNNCIANAMKTATFAKTKIGGSFSYPFVFLKDPPKGQVLDRDMIRVGVAKISAKIRGCNNGVNAKGTLKLKVVVAPAGNVTSVGIEQSPDDYVAKCVADVFASAAFEKTEQGATFTHPIVF
jgi:outer membrane biosynthesis protein TonB